MVTKTSRLDIIYVSKVLDFSIVFEYVGPDSANGRVRLRTEVSRPRGLLSPDDSEQF